MRSVSLIDARLAAWPAISGPRCTLNANGRPCGSFQKTRNCTLSLRLRVSWWGRRDLPHDDRAASLESVFRDHNPEGRHGKAKDLCDSDLRDLITFLTTP